MIGDYCCRDWCLSGNDSAAAGNCCLAGHYEPIAMRLRFTIRDLFWLTLAVSSQTHPILFFDKVSKWTMKT